MNPPTWSAILRRNLAACATPAEASAYLWAVRDAALRCGWDPDLRALHGEAIDATAARFGELTPKP